MNPSDTHHKIHMSAVYRDYNWIMKFKTDIASKHSANPPDQAYRVMTQVRWLQRSQVKSFVFFLTEIQALITRFCKCSSEQGDTTEKNRGVMFPVVNNKFCVIYLF